MARAPSSPPIRPRSVPAGFSPSSRASGFVRRRSCRPSRRPKSGWRTRPTRDEPVHPVIRLYYETYNSRRFQQGAALFAADAVIEHAPFGRPQLRGGAGYLESAERSIVAFPDAHIEILGVRVHDSLIYDV